MSKKLACVAGLAGGPAAGLENLVILLSKGGSIVPERMVTLILPKDKPDVTEFSRKGHVYVMDAWVRKQDVIAPSRSPSNSGFIRQG